MSISVKTIGLLLWKKLNLQYTPANWGDFVFFPVVWPNRQCFLGQLRSLRNYQTEKTMFCKYKSCWFKNNPLYKHSKGRSVNGQDLKFLVSVIKVKNKAIQRVRNDLWMNALTLELWSKVVIFSRCNVRFVNTSSFWTLRIYQPAFSIRPPLPLGLGILKKRCPLE